MCVHSIAPTVSAKAAALRSLGPVPASSRSIKKNCSGHKSINKAVGSLPNATAL